MKNLLKAIAITTSLVLFFVVVALIFQLVGYLFGDIGLEILAGIAAFSLVSAFIWQILEGEY